ncbi:MAG: efflux RND transporter permease subunit [Trueperaceae bacterium]|nr:efflux RND transporter permease subunit [Trueperaceae bacterium]
MNPLIRFFVRRYVFAIAIFLAVAFFGLSAGTRLGIELLPEFDIPIVAVSTTYTGAGSQETAEQLSEPIEDAIATVPGVTDVSSFSGEGFSFVIAQFASSVDVDQAAIDVKQRVDGIVDSLPDDASTPVVQKFDPSDQPILSLAVQGTGLTLDRIEALAEETIEPVLQQVDGVADVAVVGPIAREIQVLVDPAALQSYGLSAGQIASAIGAGSATLPAGSLTVGGERILLSLRDRPESAEDVAEMVVDPVRGLLVRDVARIQDTIAEPSAFTRLNNEPVVLLEVRKVSGANAVSTARALKSRLRGLELPEGVAATVVGDTSVFVESSVIDTVRETGLAILAVALVVLLFVGRLGSTFSVVLAIPITLLGAVAIFGLLGFTFNTVTLLAITVAVGLVVDDSIVIAENVERWRRNGAGAMDAVFKGAGEVSVAVLSATLSLLAVFIPIAFLPGLIGQFFSQFGLSLAATIFVSYLEAMFFLTVRLAYLPDPLPPSWSSVRASATRIRADLRWTVLQYRRRWLAVVGVVLAGAGALDGARGGVLASTLGLEAGALAALALGTLGLAVAAALPWALLVVGVPTRTLAAALGAALRNAHEATDAGVRWLRERYAVALKAILTPRASTIVLVVAVALVASLGWVVPRIQFNFVSQVDAGAVAVTIEMPPGTPLERTDVVSSTIERAVADHPAVENVVASIGSGGLLGTDNAQLATITLELVPLGQRGRSSFEVADDLRPRVAALLADVAPEADATVGSDDGGAVPVETGLELSLQASDLDLLRERDEAARRVMRDSASLRNVASSLEGSVTERVFDLDRTALAGTGLTAAEIGATLRTYNVGTRAGDLEAGGENVGIVVRADPRFIADEQTLLSLPIYAPALQTWLPLSELGRFRVQAGPVAIDRANQAYVSTLTADIVDGAPGQFQVRNDIEEAFAAAGVTDERVTVGTGVGPDLLGDLVFYGPLAFLLAIALNYLVIASQFNSFKYPLYLLATVPLALVGAFWLFFLTGSALDVISVLGVVILIGLVTKNAILLLDVVISGLEENETLERALVRAGRLRLRPILMTALTVVIISVPLLLGLGEGSEFRKPLGLVIVGGVVSSTFLTLFVVPAAFFRFERHRFASEPVATSRDLPAARSAPPRGEGAAPGD